MLWLVVTGFYPTQRHGHPQMFYAIWKSELNIKLHRRELVLIFTCFWLAILKSYTKFDLLTLTNIIDVNFCDERQYKYLQNNDTLISNNVNTFSICKKKY